MTGGDIAVFIGLTVILFGGAAFLMGQAIAETWRPVWQNVFYGLLLAAANRFLAGALFQRDWLSLTQYLLDSAVIVGLAMLAYRVTRARQMVTQYPWLYEKAGLMAWRDRGATGG
jgi:hypothetical protein